MADHQICLCCYCRQTFERSDARFSVFADIINGSPVVIFVIFEQWGWVGSASVVLLVLLLLCPEDKNLVDVLWYLLLKGGKVRNCNLIESKMRLLRTRLDLVCKTHKLAVDYLTRSLRTTSILVVIGRIYHHQFKDNYLKN